MKMKDRVWLEAQQFALELVTIGAFIAVNVLFALYLLECELKIFHLRLQGRILRFQGRILRLKGRHLRFLLSQSFLKNGRKRNFFQKIQDYTHEVLLSR